MNGRVKTGGGVSTKAAFPIVGWGSVGPREPLYLRGSRCATQELHIAANLTRVPVNAPCPPIEDEKRVKNAQK